MSSSARAMRKCSGGVGIRAVLAGSLSEKIVQLFSGGRVLSGNLFPDFACEPLFSRLVPLPGVGSNDHSAGNADREQRSQSNDCRTGREGSFFRNHGGVKHVDGWNFFGLLHLGEFVFLGEEFVNRLLNLGLTIK